MKLFVCQSCHQVLFFESVVCTSCGHALAYLPDRAVVSAIEPAEELAGAWRPASGTPVVGAMPDGAPLYRLCRNCTEHGVCNWALPADEEAEYCRACRLNHVIPNLGSPGGKEAWRCLEIAKRRAIYTLYQLGLEIEPKGPLHPEGLMFDFLEDSTSADAPKVLTGHDNGLVTINVAEAQAPFREKMRQRMGEAYRTVLGHFRHEVGHYYWDRLIRNSSHLEAFRERFGDERADYDAAGKRHYASGPPADWPTRFVSAYSSMHPWEDWAETWAHYLHMFDTIETANAYGLSLEPATDANAFANPVALREVDRRSFDELVASWVPLSMALNSLNRSMGLNDFYPFVLSDVAIAKLRFVHDVIASQAIDQSMDAPPRSAGPALVARVRFERSEEART
jgi:hypothetical protein